MGQPPPEGELRHITSIVNFRDVGRTINEFLGKKFVREGLLYRSARPDDVSDEDTWYLRDVLGIKSVLDLRSKTEHVKQLEKYRAEGILTKYDHDTAFDDDPASHFVIPGLQQHHVSVTGRSLEMFLLWQLSWTSLFRCIFYFLSGYRIQGVAVLGREVMQPRGLLGLGLDTLDHSRRELATAMRCLTGSPGLPLIAHCTQGKDRTGIVIALVLLVLGVPVAAIEHDYALTDQGLTAERESRLAEIKEIGLTEAWGFTDPRMIKGVVKHLNSRYGGVESYLDQIGFAHHERRKLRDLLLY